MKLEGTQTLKNLARAFETETRDGAKYQFLRQAAEQQQLNFVANVLKMLSTNEMAHAKIWWDLITNKDKDSLKNIDVKAGFPFDTGDFVEQFKITMNIEKEEGETLYLDFARTAKKEGFADVAKKFEMVAEVEKTHAQILQQLYEGLKSGNLYKSETPVSWKCSGCGYESTDKTAWKPCPACEVPQGYAIRQGVM